MQYIISGTSRVRPQLSRQRLGLSGRSPAIRISTVGQQRQIPGGYEVVCWDPNTLGDELDGASIPWAFYTATINFGDLGIWSAYQAIKHIYQNGNGPDWKNDIVTPQTQFFSDVSSGNLRAVSWVTPTWENSDHAGSGSNTGPSWVASLVNAVGQIQILGFDGHLHFLGRLRRLVRSGRRPPARRLRRPWIAASHADRFRLREKRLRLARSVQNTAAS